MRRTERDGVVDRADGLGDGTAAESCERTVGDRTATDPGVPTAGDDRRRPGLRRR